MTDPQDEVGDKRLRSLFEEFRGQLVSPGGAASLLGLSRKTIYTLGEQGKIRVFRSDDSGQGGDGPRWVYIPLIDLKKYADRVGRPFPKMPFGIPMDEEDP